MFCFIRATFKHSEIILIVITYFPGEINLIEKLKRTVFRPLVLFEIEINRPIQLIFQWARIYIEIHFLNYNHYRSVLFV